MWNTEIKRKENKSASFFLQRKPLMAMGIVSIVVSFVVLGFSLFEAFMGGGNIKVLRLPGFQELELKPGLYAGVYQHRDSSPIPVKALTQMDVRVMSKDTYDEVPVLMNSAGQTFDRLGFRGLPLFNFAISRTDLYTISGVTTGSGASPTVNVLLIPQSAGNIKQTLFVGIAFFVFFLALGIILLVKLERWSPKKLVAKP